MKKVKGSMSVMTMVVIYCIKPVLQGIIHYCLENHSLFQLFSLGMVELISSLFMCTMQIKYSLFKNYLLWTT